MTPTDFAGLYRQVVPEPAQHRSTIEAVLGASARQIAAGLPRITWHIEGPPSRVYALQLLLVFVDERRPEDELLVVSVTLARDQEPRWAIDATGLNGALIAEEAGISEAQGAEMGADAELAAQRVAEFLARCRPLLVDVLTSSRGDIPGR